MVYDVFSVFSALCETLVAPNGTLQQQELPALTWRGSQGYKSLSLGAASRICLATC